MRPNLPSQTAQRLAAPLLGCRLMFRMVCSCGREDSARFLQPVAFCADVQHACGVVVTCEVSRRVRTMFAEPDPHLPPPDVKLQTFLLSAVRASARVRSGFRASGLPQLRGNSLAGTGDIVSPAIGLSDWQGRLGGSRPSAQSYVGKPPT